MPQIQVRVPDEMVDTLDRWVKEGRFKSRSDAIRIILARHEEREMTRKFYGMLRERSRDAEENPEKLILLE